MYLLLVSNCVAINEIEKFLLNCLKLKNPTLKRRQQQYIIYFTFNSLIISIAQEFGNLFSCV